MFPDEGKGLWDATCQRDWGHNYTFSFNRLEAKVPLVVWTFQKPGLLIREIGRER